MAKIKNAKDANLAVRRFNLVQPIMENEGWDFLRRELMAEADECFAEIETLEVSLTAGKVGADEYVMAARTLIGKWYNLMRLAYRPQQLAKENREADAFLKKAAQKEQKHA
jgi:hypothetical protein